MKKFNFYSPVLNWKQIKKDILSIAFVVFTLVYTYFIIYIFH